LIRKDRLLFRKKGKFVINFEIRITEEMKKIKTESNKGIPYDIPVEGSLGLLALGAAGIIEWRKVRDANAGKEKTK
jgi:hypothetical protein